MPIQGTPPSGEQATPYTANAVEPLVCEKFQGINTSTSRPGVPDEQTYWMDGFMPLGPRQARTLPGIGPALWSTTPTVVFFDFANIGATPIMIGFKADGSIWQVNTDTSVATQIAAPGTITNPSRLSVGITQYGSQYVLIVAKQTDGYFIWDGTTFFAPGDPAPDSGTMPTGIGGTTVETYSGRVWIANGPVVVFTAPGTVADFTSGDGGGSFTSSDSFLRVGYTQLKQTNGFLYLIGDSSVNYISGVQTSGSPPETTFTNQNADPEVGTPWPGTVDVFGRNILFANAFGAHVSYGAAVTKISEALDGVYATVPNFGGLTPSAAKSIIYGKKVWILLIPIIDPVTGQQTNKLFMWNSKLWWSSPQDIELKFIQHQEINSVITAYGTDGNSVYPLFAQPSTAFEKTIQTRLWDKPIGYQHVKAIVRLWGLVQYFDLREPELTVAIDNETGSSVQTVEAGLLEATWINNSNDAVPWINNSSDPVTWLRSGAGNGRGVVVFEPTAVGQQGVLTGMTLTTHAADMALISIMMQPEIIDYRG